MQRCSLGAGLRLWIAGGAMALACGGKQESGVDSEIFELCAGEYAGTYRGDVSGNLTGTLERSGKFSIAFTQQGSTNSLRGSGTVGDDGAISLKIQSNVIDGTLDLGRCVASGTWQFGASSNGTWQLKKR